MSMDWYEVPDAGSTDTPSLVIYPERVQHNIDVLKKILPDTSRLRPHVKTHKSDNIVSMLMKDGITKFKCATIAEAEMLAQAGAPDVLLAYQPVGPKAVRFHSLVTGFSDTLFSCLIDDLHAAEFLSSLFAGNDPVAVFIDLNIGMNRTGIIPANAEELYVRCLSLPGIRVAGLHAYDGHLRDADFQLRTQQCDEAFAPVVMLAQTIKERHGNDLIIVAGGTPTFPIHAKRQNVECSPGTFIYWDTGYASILKEQHYIFAALVMTRVISKPTEDTLCVDLGHKAIASENPIGQRVTFLNAPELAAIGHSEEHMIVKTEKGNSWKVGDVLYGVPFHICPTCALYDAATIVIRNKVAAQWTVSSRKRVITL